MLGLFVELVDLAVLIGIEDTEARSLRKRNVDYSDRAGGILFLVVLKHFVVVHLVDVVARENHHVIGIIALYVIDILIDSVRGS